MIKKLSEYKITKRDGDYINADNNTKIINTLVCKINELVDAVNNLQTANTHIQNDLFEMRYPKSTENVPDLDIQLSWIGHLCRFWDYDKIVESTYAILDDINVWCEHPYCNSNGNQYKHCEPVKPDDDIIYKGE